MAQPHAYMPSMALSGRALVLTGRWSMLRGQIMTDPNFAANLLQDVLHHPRLGPITMLTGDHKSTWPWVVEQGWDVTCMPDVAIYCLESLPGKGFVLDTIGLQKRWFGNLARGGAKALKLGPREPGLFAWIALLDQRASMWTPSFGIVFFGTAAILHDPVLLWIYVLWVGPSRATGAAFATETRHWRVSETPLAPGIFVEQRWGRGQGPARGRPLTGGRRGGTPAPCCPATHSTRSPGVSSSSKRSLPQGRGRPLWPKSVASTRG